LVVSAGHVVAVVAEALVVEELVVELVAEHSGGRGLSMAASVAVFGLTLSYCRRR